MIKRGRKSGQVWVETVIYTLIALTIIGLFLSFAKPKVEEIQDKSIVEQSVEMLEDINDITSSIVAGGPGNQRVIELGIKKGTLFIDGVDDNIRFEMDGRYAYTEPGPDGTEGPKIQVGNIIATTRQVGKVSTVSLISNYTNIYNITYQGDEKEKVVSKSPAPYKISFLYRTKDANGNPIIDISIV